MSRIVRVAAIQHARIVGDVQGNLEKIAEGVERAAMGGAQIIGLPELSNTGYICSVVNDDFFDLAEPIPGPTTRFYEKLARKFGVNLVGGLYERDADTHVYYNTAVVCTPQGLIGRYRKTHIPSKSTFMEKYYFSPGNLGYPVFDLGLCRIGITICYDRHFPECYRHLSLKGAEIVFSINNTGSKYSIQIWDSEMICNAYCNGIYVVQVNAYGEEGPAFLHGNSAVVGPFGNFLSHAKEGEEIVIADCDLDEMIPARRNLGSVRDVVWSDLGLDGRQNAYLTPNQEQS